MKIEVHLHATLRIKDQEGGWQVISIDLEDNAVIKDLLDQLDLSLEPEHLLIVLNGKTAEIDQVLTDGDILNLMTAVSGGNKSNLRRAL